MFRTRVESSVSRVASEWQGSPAVVRLVWVLRLAAVERLALATGSGWVGGCSSVEQQRLPGPAQVPGEVVGEHAEEDVGLDVLLEPVVDGAQLEPALERTEGALDLLELLVGAHDVGRFELRAGDAGAQDVDAVERGLGRRSAPACAWTVVCVEGHETTAADDSGCREKPSPKNRCTLAEMGVRATRRNAVRTDAHSVTHEVADFGAHP